VRQLQRQQPERQQPGQQQNQPTTTATHRYRWPPTNQQQSPDNKCCQQGSGLHAHARSYVHAGMRAKIRQLGHLRSAQQGRMRRIRQYSMDTVGP
jgi:hypothetical protein